MIFFKCEKKSCLVPAQAGPAKKNHVSSRPRPALRKKSCLVRARPALRKKIMSRPGPGRPCEKEIMSRPGPGRPCERKFMSRPSPGRPCEKKIMSRQAPAGLRKENHVSSSGWAGLAGPPDHQKSIRFFSKTPMGDSPCSNPYKACRLWILLVPILQNGLEK